MKVQHLTYILSCFERDFVPLHSKSLSSNPEYRFDVRESENRFLVLSFSSVGCCWSSVCGGMTVGGGPAPVAPSVQVWNGKNGAYCRERRVVVDENVSYYVSWSLRSGGAGGVMIIGLLGCR